AFCRFGLDEIDERRRSLPHVLIELSVDHRHFGRARGRRPPRGRRRLGTLGRFAGDRIGKSENERDKNRETNSAHANLSRLTMKGERGHQETGRNQLTRDVTDTKNWKQASPASSSARRARPQRLVDVG